MRSRGRGRRVKRESLWIPRWRAYIARWAFVERREELLS